MAVVTTDVVGGVEALAKMWADADTELEASQEGLRIAQARVEHHRTRKEEAARKLAERVGPRAPLLVIQVSETEVVVVNHERSILRTTLARSK